MSCNNCNNNCSNSGSCNCNCTTTTTCSPVAEKPCITICSDIYATECIIYDGEDNECYGVKNGDNIKDIIDNIITKLAGQNCDCEFGDAIINLVTTTTSSTTTISPYNVCITIYDELNCNFTNQEITSGSFINGKESYSFTYNATGYIIKWSIVENRWEIYLQSNLSLYLAYLESDSQHPIGPLKGGLTTNGELSWISDSSVDSILFTTRESCPEQLCGTFVDEGGFIELNFKSQYDTLGNVPSQPTILKHYYIGCVDQNVYEIKWNLFANRYELYSGSTLLAYTLQQDLEQLSEINWTFNPDEIGTPFYGFKTKVGACLVS
jgi:hypothetical protein